MIEIELFDGTILQFPAGTSQDVIDNAARQETAARQQSAAGQPAPMPPAPTQQAPAPQVTHTTSDGGRIVRMPDGSRAFTSPGYATVDPAEIDRLMEGATPAELVRSSISEQILRERPVASRVATAAQGIPFVGTYTDEMAAAISPEAGDRARRAVEAVREERPGQAMGLEVAGALSSIPLLAAATPAAIPAYVSGATSLAGTAARSGLVGGIAGTIEGAISGFGRGEGEGRVEAAQEGATFGLIGAPIGVAMPIAGFGIEKAVAAFQALKGIGTSEIARKLGISNDAAKVVKTALQNDDFDAAQLALQRAGSTSMLADAGPATQQLLDVSIAAGGTAPRVAGQALEGRLIESGERMTRVLDDMFGSPEGTNALRSAIREETALPRSSTYRAAYAQPIDYSGRRGRHLENLMRRVPQSAVNRANELMRLEGVQSAQILADVAADGSITFSRLPDVRQLDYITRALGDVASTQNAQGVLGGTTQLGRATENLSRDIRKTLRNEVPEYAVALDTAADAINRSKAVELGASIFNPSTTREVLRDGLRGASKSEKEAAKAGFRSAFDERLANVRAVASDPNTDIREFQQMANQLRSRAMRNNMETLLGPKDANKLYKELDEQVVALELRAAVARNSATARRQAIQGQVQDLTAPNVLETLLSGEPLNAGKRIIAATTGNTTEARALRQMGIYDEIARVLVNVRGPEAQNALRIVQRAMAGDALTQVQARMVAKAMTRPAAMAAYATSRPEVPAEPPAYMGPPPPVIPPQARVQPPTVPTRGLPAAEQPAPAAGAQGGVSNSREMLSQLFPFDDIAAIG